MLRELGQFDLMALVSNACKRGLVAALWLALAPLAAAEAEVMLSECRIADTSKRVHVDAECGRFTVAEDPSTPDGRSIDLFVARIPALGTRTTESAFTLLAGGPGQAATEFYAAYYFAFERLRSDFDILLVDQRGTGHSNRLGCELPDEEPGAEFNLELVADYASDCLESLDAGLDFYTTSVAVRDLNAVRAALGYEKLDLYGLSYGTRVAQHFLRMYPQYTRSVVLDGVVPVDYALGPGIAIAAQRALNLVFQRCESDQRCNVTFPNLSTSFADLQDRLRATGSVEIELDNPVTGEPITANYGYFEFMTAVRLLSYTPDTVALLPMLIQQAVDGDYAALAAQAMMTTASIAEALAYGMHNSVVCAEDVPFIDPESLDEEALVSTYLGRTQVDALIKICEIWPSGYIDAGFKKPFASEVPVLILSGEADPITPPSYGDHAAAYLGDALHIVVPGQGHGQAAVGCIPRLVAEYVQQASLAQLDASCVQRQTASPFFLNFSGSTP